MGEMALAIIGLAGKIFDKVIPDPAQAAQAKLQLLELAQKGELTELTAKADIVKSEAQSEHWLTAVWRPITMLVFTALIVARWFGWAAPNLHEEEYIKLWDIVQLGLGGYVIGRSAEKIVPAVTDAIKNKGA